MADKSAHKAKVRDRILDEAARALRTAGTEGLSVANLMQRAGLTHGGFYAHFANREDLVVHAIDRMFEDSTSRLWAPWLAADGAAPDLGKLVDNYLSESAMRNHDRGCPLPWLSGEVPRMPPPAQARFHAAIARMREGIARTLRDQGRSPERAEALAGSAVAEMVGAMALARAMGEGDAARDLLATSREAIKRRLLEG